MKRVMLLVALLGLVAPVMAEDFVAKLEFQVGGAFNLTDHIAMGSLTLGGVTFQEVATIRFGSFMADGAKTLWGPTLGINLKSLISKIPGATYHLPLEIDLSYAPVINPFDAAWPVKHLINATVVKF